MLTAKRYVLGICYNTIVFNLPRIRRELKLKNQTFFNTSRSSVTV